MPDPITTPRVTTPLLINADNIPESVAALQSGPGPVVIVVPGTGADALTDTTLAVVQQMNANQPGVPANVGVIAYDSTLGNAVRRFVHDSASGDDALRGALRALGASGSGKPVYLLSESQGSWLVDDVLRQDPESLAAVTRAMLFSKPAFAKLPAGDPGVPAVPAVADDPPLAASYSDKILQIDHTDDIVPGLFRHIDGQRIASAGPWIKGIVTGHGSHYVPHHYIADAAAGATFLQTGVRLANPIHSSHIHNLPPVAPQPVEATPVAPQSDSGSASYTAS